MSGLSPRATAVVYQVTARAVDYPDEELLASLPVLRAALDEVCRRDPPSRSPAC